MCEKYLTLPTIIEKLEAYSDVSCAISILTPDDVGRKAKSTKEENRARQNVIFEMGLFMGKIGRQKVIALCHELITFPSDYNGILYIKLDKKGKWIDELNRELAAIEII